ncbi:MAG: DNA (cytosine-5-)-methyltransferase [Tagaea sp. CACIAM 22H2]|nr:DNA (cytosine-5-)-methyltransferase [Tagaea sp. CACIAM 22H2]
MQKHRAQLPTLLDLFCGCGGFTLGAHSAGFETALSVDIDPNLTFSFQKNFPSASLRLTDIASITATSIKRDVAKPIDGIIGGPPCQGFSSIGRQDANDPRRNLLVDFFRLVRDIEPKFFLMENVRGLGYERNRHVLDHGISLLPSKYKILGPMVVNCADFGAPTSRPRLFVFGYDPNRMSPMNEAMFAGNGRSNTVRDAIADLYYFSDAGFDDEGYDLWKSQPELELSEYARALRGRTRIITGHKKTPHRPEISKRFSTVKPGDKDEVGKHVRLSWGGKCPTLRAGTGSDRGSYQSVRPIHPSQNRVITVREAARIQGFPDAFRFHPTVWHSFRMIGNSVSPILATELLSRIQARLELPIIRSAAE